MDAQTLRLALVVIGIIIIVSIFYLSGSDKRRQKNIKRKLEKQQNSASRTKEIDSGNDEPGVQQELDALKGMGAMIAADKRKEGASREQEEHPSQATVSNKHKPSRKVVTLYLQ